MPRGCVPIGDPSNSIKTKLANVKTNHLENNRHRPGGGGGLTAYALLENNRQPPGGGGLSAHALLENNRHRPGGGGPTAYALLENNHQPPLVAVA